MDATGSFYGVPDGRPVSILPRVRVTRCGPALTSISHANPHQMGWVVYVRGDRHILWKFVYPQPHVDTLVRSNHTDRGRRIYRLVDLADRFNHTPTVNLPRVRLIHMSRTLSSSLRRRCHILQSEFPFPRYDRPRPTPLDLPYGGDGKGHSSQQQ